VACAALLLGGKVEESPQKLPQLLQTAVSVRYAGKQSQLERARVLLTPERVAAGLLISCKIVTS
jgi:hypothetical protein